MLKIKLNENLYRYIINKNKINIMNRKTNINILILLVLKFIELFYFDL